ncbi:MAG: 4-hydroxy-3-methylbut-2-enyl diphosphate reductase [Candidatus Omnitrophica bacterium]|nr:4-hydroxy-3-methylbut-2-enyl diphosphate reductase [Candidatus Omnitrophota bacterium]
MKPKINLAKSAGFCFGVKRAIDIALKSAGDYPLVEMLGDIVHNEDVCRDIAASGIKKVKVLKNGKGKVLLIRAHGSSLKTMKQARGLGYKLIDATCPMVKEIHKIAQGLEKEGRVVIIIGDENHHEVKGIVGNLKRKPLIISNKLSLARLKKIKKAGMVVQSTQNSEKVKKIVKSLRVQIKDLKFFNTICVPTRRKQAEIRILPLKNDVVVIIGSKTSANTRRLYEISRSVNKKSHWVQSDNDLRKEWFKGAKRIGITAGASTPDKVTKKIIEKIRALIGVSS